MTMPKNLLGTGMGWFLSHIIALHAIDKIFPSEYNPWLGEPIS